MLKYTIIGGIDGIFRNDTCSRIYPKIIDLVLASALLPINKQAMKYKLGFKWSSHCDRMATKWPQQTLICKSYEIEY